MKNLKLRLHTSQAGFTLVELLAAIMITGFLGLGVAVACGQLLTQTSKDTNYTSASRQAANAIYWIGRDVLMAQKIEGWQNFPAASLVLSWKDWDNTASSANYTVVNGALYRVFSNGTNTSSTRIAENINTGEDLTFCNSDNGTVTLTVTASAGKGSKTVNVTKTRVITTRPKR